MYTLSYTTGNFDEMRPCLGCGKDFWCTRLVLTWYHQTQGSHAATVETQGWLGRPCAWRHPSHMATMEKRGTPTLSEGRFPAVSLTRMMSKDKVAPIKQLTIPRLELCGAHLIAQFIHHVRQVLYVPLSHVRVWNDSTIVLNWLDRSPIWFKTYVGNRISTTVDLIPPDKWRHVHSADNPADCASRGLYPSELLNHSLWWNGPTWLKESPSHWPEKLPFPPNQQEIDENEVSLHILVQPLLPIISINQFSSFVILKHVTAWILCSIQIAWTRILLNGTKLTSPPLNCRQQRITGFDVTTKEKLSL